MNKVILMGRLSKDPEVRYGGADNKIAVAKYTLAVDRPKYDGKEQQPDWIPCTAFGKGGEFAEKYLKKGMKIVVEGRLQTGKYEKDGQTVYTWGVAVEHQEFAEKKADNNQPNLSAADGFMNIPDGLDEELPFN